MGRLLESIREQITPPVAFGLGLLFLIACYYVFETFSQWNERLTASVSEHKLQIAQMQALADAPAQTSVNDRMSATLESLNSRMLRESTVGLNAAAFQQEVRQTLQGCGWQNVSVNMSFPDDPEFSELTIYESSVRARDIDSRLAVCLDSVSKMSVAAQITYLRWTGTGAVQMNIVGFSAE